MKYFILGLLLLFTVFSNARTPVAPRTSVSFRTSDKTLQQLFDRAEAMAEKNIVRFGNYQVLVEGGGYTNVWLETQPMGGYMYAKRNLSVARNNSCIFMDFQREDGRFPGMISCNNDTLIPHYGWFQGYCFPMPAFELYFLLGKDKAYLNRLYASLEKFDQYLWKVRDSDGDGCLETWCVYDTGEDNCTRFGESPNAWPFDFPPTKERIMNMTEKERNEYCHKSAFDFSKEIPVPIESMDIMSYSYAGRDVLARISKELDNGRERYWRDQADLVRQKMKDYLWNEEKHACFDRDKDNNTMNILLHNNLRCMYYGSFDQQMADDFVKDHLMNPNEFWTPMPLPSIAVNDAYFRNNAGNDWSGQPEALTYQRSIRALENYGHFAELTLIGQKFLKVVGDTLKFTQQFDPFRGTVSSSGQDGYGPAILASLEFISRLYGIHITQDRIYWSCLNSDQSYDYSQTWGNRLYEIKTRGHQVHCFVNGKEVFSFTKGIRLVSDLNGKIMEAVGIETKDINAEIVCKKKTFRLKMSPNKTDHFLDKFEETRQRSASTVLF